MSGAGETIDHIRKAAEAARLRLDDGEAEAMARRLDGLGALVERLQQVDTAGVEPAVYGAPTDAAGGTGQDGWRSDEVRPSLPREAVLQGAPEAQDGYFKVPRVLEEE